jgi:hypothetical protein
MANILDDLFHWAAQQPASNETQVDIALTSVEVSRKNLVTYSEGSLKYHPPHSAGMLRLPAYFGSDPNQIKQYVSDRRSRDRSDTPATPAGDPFDPNNTDPLTVSIFRPIVSGNYTITIKSTKWNWEESFTPIFDAATNVLYGNLYTGLLLVALCGQRTQVLPA